jgi:hypothetical protein
VCEVQEEFYGHRSPRCQVIGGITVERGKVPFATVATTASLALFWQGKKAAGEGAFAPAETF